MNVEKTCAACKKPFREPASEPFLTCPACRKPDVIDHPQSRKAEPKAFKNGTDDWEDLCPQDDEQIDWDDIHRAYEDQQQ